MCQALAAVDKGKTAFLELALWRGNARKGEKASTPHTVSEGYRSSRCGSVITNPASIHEDSGSIPGLSQWVKDLVLP